MSEWLSDLHMDMVFFIERHHAMHGEVPSDEIMNKRFNVETEALAEFKSHPLVQKSMRYRGINYPSLAEQMTDRQMAAVATMTNYVDKRSDEKKLRDIGITTREWGTWLLDDNFQNYLRERSERMLTAAQHEAHMGLIKGMRNGNVASVRLYNEMVGRYNPEADSNFNAKMFLYGCIEVFQRHIKDPVVLHAISTDLMNLAAREGGMMQNRYAPVANAPKVIALKGEI